MDDVTDAPISLRPVAAVAGVVVGAKPSGVERGLAAVGAETHDRTPRRPNDSSIAALPGFGLDLSLGGDPTGQSCSDPTRAGEPRGRLQILAGGVGRQTPPPTGPRGRDGSYVAVVLGGASGSEHALARRLAHGLTHCRRWRSAARPLRVLRRHPEQAAGERDDDRHPDPRPEPLSDRRPPDHGPPPRSALATIGTVA